MAGQGDESRVTGVLVGPDIGVGRAEYTKVKIVDDLVFTVNGADEDQLILRGAAGWFSL